jgi:hypothetical protein
MLRLSTLLLLLLAASSPASAEWLRGESPNFIVYSEGTEARLRQRILLLEDYDRLLRFMTSVNSPPASTKLTVYVVRGFRELQAANPRLTGDVAGFYMATPTGIAAFVDHRAEAGDNEVLFHEYAHHFMMQYAASAYPPWYVEGFAEYFMTARFEENTIDVGRSSDARGPWILNGQWLPIDLVLFRGPEGMNGELAARYYAQSWLIAHYFHSADDRRQLLGRYLAALAAGGESRASFEATIQMTPKALDDALHQYVRNRRIAITRLLRTTGATPPPIQISRLPSAADDLLLYRAALDIGTVPEDSPKDLNEIRAAAARHASDPFAQRVLAQAEISLGDPAAADALLDPLLAAAPGDAELLYLKGLRHLRASEDADDPEPEARLARRWFARAYAANPDHFQTLYHYHQSLAGSDESGSENTLNILLLARQLAPQVTNISLATATALLNRRRYEDAEAVLRPLSGDVHNPSVAAAAQQLIDVARSRGSPPSEDHPADAPPAEDPPAEEDG